MTAEAAYAPAAWLLVAVGSALGGALRYWLSGRISTGPGERFPLGTLVVNVTGCLAAGGVFGALDGLSPGPGPQGWLAFGVVGVLGSYTTVSSFSLQTLQLIDDGDWRGGVLNVALSFSGCLGGAGLGFWLGYWVGTGLPGGVA